MEPPADEERGFAPHTYGMWVAVSFGINYIVGVGVLAIPSAFQTAGIFFSIAVMVTAGAFLTLASTWVVETGARAVGWAAVVFAASDKGGGGADGETFVLRLRNALERPAAEVAAAVARYEAVAPRIEHSPADTVGTPLLPTSGTPSDGAEAAGAVTTDWREPRMDEGFRAVGGRLFEMNELLEVFAPLWAVVAYEFAVVSMLFMALWSFASVFGNSMIAKFPLLHGDWSHSCTDDFDGECAWSFRIFVLLVGAISVYLTLSEFSELVVFQITLTFLRFLLIAVVALTSLVGLYTDPVDNESARPSAPYLGQDYKTWEWSGIVSIISTTFFAQLVCFGLAAIQTPMRDKSKGRRMVVLALGLTNALYTLVGVTAALYFGSALEPQINLNYESYAFGHRDSTPWYARPLQFFVVVFPALDVCSMSPLIATSLGNSIRGILVRVSDRLRAADLAGSRAPLVFARLLAAVPPVLCALVERDLSTIIRYASLPALWIGLVAPICMQYYSRRVAARHGVAADTPYSLGALSRGPGLVLTSIFAVVCYFFVIGGLADKHFAGDIGIH